MVDNRLLARMLRHNGTRLVDATVSRLLPDPARPQNPSLGRRIAQGAPCTWFLTPSTPVTARKKWIAGSLEPRGTVHVDAGAARALFSGKSLLPAGVTRVEGNFDRGDCVILRDASGAEIGRGLVVYDAGEAGQLVGRNSRDIEAVLGVPGRAEMIHRDDLVLG